MLDAVYMSELINYTAVCLYIRILLLSVFIFVVYMFSLTYG